MFNLRADFSVGEYVLENFINLSDEEKEMVRNWRNSEQIAKWMFSDHTISPEEHSQFTERLKNDDRNFYWTVRHGGGEYCGVISLNKVDFKNKNAYLGVYANPGSRLPGAGRILVECLKNVAFDMARLHTLKLEVIYGNDRAVDFYRKSGFAEEGRLKEFVFKKGGWYDVIIMGIVNSITSNQSRKAEKEDP